MSHRSLTLKYFSTCGAIVRCLDDRKLHVSKITWLLGFHEVSAFTNAFKRFGQERRRGQLALSESKANALRSLARGVDYATRAKFPR